MTSSPDGNVIITKSPTRAKSFVLETRLFVARPIEEVLGFFADARNLERLTPSHLKFSVVTPAPIELRAGALIDYRLRVRGIPIRWRSEITVWEPPHRFVDEQRVGPYRYWHHEHLFERAEGGTMVVDAVTYETPGGNLVNRLLVAPELKKVFEFRREAMGRILAE